MSVILKVVNHKDFPYLLPIFIFAVVHFIGFALFRISYPIEYDHVNAFEMYLHSLKNYLERGEIPLWNEEAFGGMPLLFGGLINFKWFLFLKWMEPKNVLGLVASIDCLIAGLAFYYFITQLFNTSRRAALLGSLFWAFNGYFSSTYYDSVLYLPDIWIPLIAVCLLRWEKAPVIHFLLLILALTDSMSSGRWDNVEFSMIYLLLFVTLYTFLNSSQPWKRLGFSVFLLGFSFLLTLLINSPFVFDQLELLFSSDRGLKGIEPLQRNPTWHSYFTLVPRMEGIFPVMPGGGGAYGYIGFFGLIVVFGSLLHQKKNITYLLAALFFTFFIYDFSFLGFNPFTDFIRRLPFHHTIRYAERFWPNTLFFIAILFSTGIDPLLSPNKKPLFYSIVSSLCLTFIAFVIVMSFRTSQGFTKTPFSDVVLLAINGLAIVILWRREKHAFEYGYLVIFLFLQSYLLQFNKTIDYHWDNHDVVFSKDRESSYQFLKNERGKYRFMELTEKNYDERGIKTFFISRGLETLSGYNSLISKRTADFLSQFLEGEVFRQFHASQVDLDRYMLTNIKYWMIKNSVNFKTRFKDTSRLKLVFSNADSDFNIYSADTLPRYYLATDFKILNNDNEYRSLTTLVHKDPHWFRSGVALSQVEVDKKTFQILKAPIGSITPVQLINYRKDFLVQTQSGGFFVLLEAYDPLRWKAMVNGETSPILKANGMFRAVYVSPGNHRLTFQYHFPIGGWICPITGFLLAILSCLFFRWWFKKSDTKPLFIRSLGELKLQTQSLAKHF